MLQRRRQSTIESALCDVSEMTKWEAHDYLLLPGGLGRRENPEKRQLVLGPSNITEKLSGVPCLHELVTLEKKWRAYRAYRRTRDITEKLASTVPRRTLDITEKFTCVPFLDKLEGPALVFATVVVIDTDLGSVITILALDVKHLQTGSHVLTKQKGEKGVQYLFWFLDLFIKFKQIISK